MKYVTSIERRGRAEGRAEALRTAALEFLEARFGGSPTNCVKNSRRWGTKPF